MERLLSVAEQEAAEAWWTYMAVREDNSRLVAALADAHEALAVATAALGGLPGNAAAAGPPTLHSTQVRSRRI